MALSAGDRLGAFEIVGTIGEGGMGVVYRARDTRLHRDVAIKLLPAAVADDPDRLSRFRREAQLLATLNHPNIAHVYGLEEVDNEPALVMELVPGRTLSDLLQDQRLGPRGGRLQLPDIVLMARQIAEAMEAAHERGIIHRDLKPANIKVRDDGVVKILDFGLAKDQAPEAASGQRVEDQATITSPALTEVGVILGTAAYMAPEQALGRPVDKRADIWAFGVVLFEMLTGERPFAGRSVTETIAAVIKDDPRLDRLPADTPAALRTLVGRCLERDPTRRLRDIGEARILLSGPLDSPASSGATAAPARGSRGVPWIATGAAMVVLAAVAAYAAWALKPVPVAPVRRLDLAMPANVSDFAVSRDGARVAYIADHRLYVRRFDELDAKDLGLLPITATLLVWSPDDRLLAFTAQSRVRTIPVDGGPALVVADVPASGEIMDLEWLPNGMIVFSVWRDSLYGVPATGGTATVQLAIDPEREVDFHRITALPDNRLVVATHRRQQDTDIVELVELGAGGQRFTLTTDTDAQDFTHIPVGGRAGTLLFARATTNPGIWAVPFSAGAINVNEARLLIAGATNYSVARDGTLMGIVPAPSRRALVWMDPAGTETAVPGSHIETQQTEVEISPDGRRAAFVQGRYRVAGLGTGSLTDGVVVVRDLQTGVDTRLAAGTPSSTMWGSVGLPTWFPDGQRILHRTGRVEGASLVERRADIAGSARELTQGFYGRVLADGRTLIYTRDDRGAGRLMRARIGDDGRAESAALLLPRDDQPNVGDFDVSADGRLVAYVVRDPSQRGDVYLAEIARPGEQWLVQEGGARPRFAQDEQLFFLRGAEDPSGQRRGQLVRVRMTMSPTISIGSPTVVLQETNASLAMISYDVAPDGRRFLMWKASPAPAGTGQRFILAENAIAR